jgi:hypothetical protein
MRRFTRFVARPLVIGPVVVLLVASAIAAFATRGRSTPPYKPPRASAPVDRSTIEPEIIKPYYRPPQLPTLTPSPSQSVRPAPKPKAKQAPTGPILTAFRGLGAWVDTYDYDDIPDPVAAVADMKSHGVKTLYIQTGRWNKPEKNASEPFADRVLLERWIHAAHAQRLKVVGWYLPAYDDMTRDVRRTRAIALYRTTLGQRFDALGIDIEYRAEVSHEAFNAGVADHMRRVRILLGRKYPIAAITPAPPQMEVRPDYWAGFPWRSLGQHADVFMPMAYWSFRHDCDSNPAHCAYGYTRASVEEVRRLTGRPKVPVHVIGGVADSITTEDVVAYVKAATDANAYGGSLYDYFSTKPDYWAPLAKLND